METPKKILGKKLRELAEQANVTQADIARETGLRTTTINRIFQGTQGVRDKNVALILKAIGKKPGDIYKTPSVPQPMVVKAAQAAYGEPNQLDAIMNILQKLNLNQKESDLISIFKLLNDKGQDIILGLARTTLDTHPRDLKRAD